jgi:type I restriction enzyme S subunit
LAEQRRVVARIEELAAQIHEARTLRHQAAEEAEALTGASASKLFQECPERHPIMALAEVRGGIQKGPHRAPGANPVRYLTVAHVHRNRILTDSPRYFEVSPVELERWRLLRGDVLIIEGNGSADQIGRTALFRGEIENCVHQNHVIRIRPDKQRVMPEFLNTFLNSPAGQDAVQGQSRTSSGLRSLSVGRIKSICVPVPPLSEQRRIVSELDALQAQVDALKRLQAETAAELDALLPSILDKAFKGQL